MNKELRGETVYLSTAMGSFNNLMTRLRKLRVDGFVQICVVLKIFLAIPVNVASGERSFSPLKLIKNCLRSTKIENRHENRLNNLTILAIEHHLCRKQNTDDRLYDFAKSKAHKVNLL